MPTILITILKILTSIIAFGGIICFVWGQIGISTGQKMLNFLETGEGLSEKEKKEWESLPEKDKAEYTPEFFRECLQRHKNTRNEGLMFGIAVLLLAIFIFTYF